MSDPIALIISGVFKPFLKKMIPDLFVDFDSTGCDFAIVNIQTGKVDLGTMSPFKKVWSKDWDLLVGIENTKVMGMSVGRSEALEIVESLRFERHPNETIVIAKLRVDDIDDVKVTYDNREIWSLMNKQPKKPS